MLYADNKNKENVFLVLLFLGLWVSFLVLIRFFTGVDIEEQSAFLNINIVSGFLLLVYPLALGFVEKNKYPAFFLFAALVIVFSIMITQSRAAIVLSYAVTAFYFMRLGKNKNFRIFFIIVSTAAAVGIVYAFYMKTGWNSFSERFVWWKTAWLMFKDNPVFGAGFGNYGALFLYYRPEYVLNTLFAHNIFLQILAETGIVGIISFAAAFYFMAKNALQSFKNKSADSIYMKSAAVGIIIFLIFNITEYSFYIPVCLTTFFVLCGFLCRIEIEKRKSRFTFWIIIIAVLVSVYTAVLPVIAEQYYKIGKKSAAAKNYENAKEQYLKAVKYDAKNPEYLHQAADCSFKLYVLSFQTEKSYLEETIDLELHSEKFYVHSAQIKSGIANLYSLKGDLQNAEKYTEAARKFDKFNPNYGNMQ
jgi:O-antigen ligase